MWKKATVMPSSAEIRCTRFACCMTRRVWSKFGKSRMSPVTTRITDRKQGSTQNRIFSPALKRPEGASLPFLDSMPPNVFSHPRRSEEHTSELQSRSDRVCRLLLEKKKKKRQRSLRQINKETTNNKKYTKRST